MPRDSRVLKICLMAGEASGDVLGARLMRALKKEAKGDLQFLGIGGPLMEEAGMCSHFPMRDLSVMGVLEVLPRLNKILKRIKQASDVIEKERPDIVITIDSPDFSFRVADRVKKGPHNPKMIHYVAPTVWAWRPERAAKVAGLYDGIMCLYPFEPAYFKAAGMKAAFVGHSVLESGYREAGGDKLRAQLEIPADATVLGLMFGSRIGELNRVGPALREVAARLARQNEGLYILAPTFPHLQPQVKNLVQALPCKSHVIAEQGRKWDCFAAMDMALATSGTVGLELAVADVPHIIAYKMNPLTWQIVRRKLTVKYAHLANILLDAPIVPEFIQADTNAEKMMQAALPLLNDKAARQSQRDAFEKIRSSLAGRTDELPSQQAAHFALDCLYSRSSIGT